MEEFILVNRFNGVNLVKAGFYWRRVPMPPRIEKNRVNAFGAPLPDLEIPQHKELMFLIEGEGIKTFHNATDAETWLKENFSEYKLYNETSIHKAVTC